MPKFHFNLISDSGGFTPDEVGLEFDTLDDAYLDVFRAILDISFDMLKARKDPHNHSFNIADPAGVVLLEVPFSEALRPSRLGKPAPAAPECLIETVSANRRRHRALKADLSDQLSRARLTVEATKLLLSRSRAHVA